MEIDALRQAVLKAEAEVGLERSSVQPDQDPDCSVLAEYPTRFGLPMEFEPEAWPDFHAACARVYLDNDLSEPDFENAGPGFLGDWRAFVGERTRRRWSHLSRADREAVMLDAQDLATEAAEMA